MNNKIKKIEEKIAKLEAEKKSLIEQNEVKEKYVYIRLVFPTKEKSKTVLESCIKSAIKKGFDLTGLSAPLEIDFKKILIRNNDV